MGDKENELSDYYEYTLTPNVASEDAKTGVTFKGSSPEYLGAYGIIIKMMQKKGDRYIINDTEVAIVDAPATKPTVVEVKHKKGMSGKAHVKIFGINKQGGATMMITKVTDGKEDHGTEFMQV